MSVAKTQIQEIYNVFKLWIPNIEARSALLISLTQVKAYQSNKSFRETIEALLVVHKKGKQRKPTSKEYFNALIRRTRKPRVVKGQLPPMEE